jgi:hypothetical protein
MHRLHSKSSIWRLRIAAALLCLKCLMVPSVAGLLLYSLIIHNTFLILTSAALLLLTGAIVVIQWIISQRTHCPHCMTPVLAAKQCAKHKRAKSLFGSHRLRVALSVLFRGMFRCPYCNEPTALEIRPPRT